MIKKPLNWEAVSSSNYDSRKLPLGAYVVNILKVRIENTQYGDKLALMFDISEGEYAGFFREQYDNANYDGKKFKGILRINLPANDGSETDEWSKRTLKSAIAAFEDSNRGFKWDWDERKLVGKEVGILCRNEEWEFDGKTGFSVRPFRCISADRVRSGDYQLPKDKLKNKTAAPAVAPGSSIDDLAKFGNVTFTNIDEADGELPF